MPLLSLLRAPVLPFQPYVRGGPPGDAEHQLCPVCQLPLTSFNRQWHQHHSPAHMALPAEDAAAAARAFDGVMQPAAGSSKEQQQAAAAAAAQDDTQQPAVAGVPLQLLAALVAGLLLLGLLSSAFSRLLEPGKH